MNERKSIYILTSVMPIEQEETPGLYAVNPDGHVKVRKERIGVFDDVSKAEDAIMRLVRQNEDFKKRWCAWTDYFGFVLDELYLNDTFYGEGNTSLFESRRTYLSDGTLNYFSDLDDRCEKKFSGNDMTGKLVKSGDYAWFLSDGYVVPIYVHCVPMSKEEWKKHFKEGVYGDVTDDSGVAFSGHCGHFHPFHADVFPLSCLKYAVISEKEKTAMHEELRQYMNPD